MPGKLDCPRAVWSALSNITSGLRDGACWKKDLKWRKKSRKISRNVLGIPGSSAWLALNSNVLWKAVNHRRILHRWRKWAWQWEKKIRNENQKMSRTRFSSVSRGDHWKSKVAMGKNKKQHKKLFGSGCLTVAWAASSHNVSGDKRSRRRTVASCGDRKVTLQAAPKMKTFQKCIFHRWKMKKWTWKCEGESRNQDAKGERNGTYHLWKPEVRKSWGLLPQYLGLRTARKLFAEKIGQKVKEILRSDKGITSDSHTWTWCEPKARTFLVSSYDGICKGNTSFRKNGCKMIINKNGLTSSRIPCSVEKICFFWPALFPEAILILRHRLFLEKSLPLGRWLSCAWKY